MKRTNSLIFPKNSYPVINLKPYQTPKSINY